MSASATRNDHWVSRFLTTPWEVGDRFLHYFDFKTGRFQRVSSRSFFARKGLHSDATGALLSEFLEQPVAEHIAALPRLAHRNGTTEVSYKTFRALASLWWLQAMRSADATAPGELAMNLDQLLGTTGVLDFIAEKVRNEYELRVVPSFQALFFTEAAYFPIPMAAGAPLRALPLTPHLFLTGIEKVGIGHREQLQSMLNISPLITALSLGVGHKVHRIVLPPQLIPTDQQTRAELKECLQTLRDNCRRLFDLIGSANATVGLPSWEVTKPQSEVLTTADGEGSTPKAD